MLPPSTFLCRAPASEGAASRCFCLVTSGMSRKAGAGLPALLAWAPRPAIGFQLEQRLWFTEPRLASAQATLLQTYQSVYRTGERDAPRPVRDSNPRAGSCSSARAATEGTQSLRMFTGNLCIPLCQTLLYVSMKGSAVQAVVFAGDDR